MKHVIRLFGLHAFLLCALTGLCAAGESSLPLSEAEVERIATGIERQSRTVYTVLSGGGAAARGFRKFMRQHLGRIGKRAVFKIPDSTEDRWVTITLGASLGTELSTYLSGPSVPGTQFVTPGEAQRCELDARAEVSLEVDKSRPPDKKRWPAYARNLRFKIILEEDDLPMTRSKLASHKDIARRRHAVHKPMARQVAAAIRRKAIPFLANSPHCSPELSGRLQRVRGHKTYPGEQEVNPRTDGRFSRQVEDLELIGSFSPLLGIHLTWKGLSTGFLELEEAGDDSQENETFGARAYVLRGLVLDCLLRKQDPVLTEQILTAGPPALRPAGLMAAFQEPGPEKRETWPPSNLTDDLAECLGEFKRGVEPGTARAEWIPKGTAKGLIEGLQKIDTPEATDILFDMLRWRLRHTRWRRSSGGQYHYRPTRDPATAYPVYEDLDLDALLADSLRVLKTHKPEETRKLLQPLVKRRSALHRIAQKRLRTLFQDERRSEDSGGDPRRKLLRPPSPAR
jgi:hypothetical protein